MENESTFLAVQDEAQTTSASDNTKKSSRIATLDVFRGLTIAVMILVDDAGGEWPRIAHAPWNGCNLADFVMPFLLFIVGFAIALAFKRRTLEADTVKKIILRTLKLLFWGILLQGGYSHAPDDLSYGVDIRKIRFCGILQRIAFAYLFISSLEMCIKKPSSKNTPQGHFEIYKVYLSHWILALCVLLVYLGILYGLYVPDWHFVVSDRDSPEYGKSLTVNCSVRAQLNPPCNAVGYVDRKVWGINHLYHHPAWRRSKYCTANSPFEGPIKEDAPAWCWAPFEPEGLLSSISAILSTIIGVHYGHVLIHFENHSQRLKHWMAMGFGLVIIGLTLHFVNVVPLNKQLYTFSYLCVTAGAAGIIFSALYIVIDKCSRRRPFMLLEWMGMNSMLIFVMAAEDIFPGFINGWYYESPKNTLVYWIQDHVFIDVWKSKRIGMLLYVIFGEILFWCVVAGILHRLGRYWKL